MFLFETICTYKVNFVSIDFDQCDDQHELILFSNYRSIDFDDYIDIKEVAPSKNATKRDPKKLNTGEKVEYEYYYVYYDDYSSENNQDINEKITKGSIHEKPLQAINNNWLPVRGAEIPVTTKTTTTTTTTTIPFIQKYEESAPLLDYYVSPKPERSAEIPRPPPVEVVLSTPEPKYVPVTKPPQIVYVQDLPYTSPPDTAPLHGFQPIVVHHVDPHAPHPQYHPAPPKPQYTVVTQPPPPPPQPAYHAVPPPVTYAPAPKPHYHPHPPVIHPPITHPPITHPPVTHPPVTHHYHHHNHQVHHHRFV